MSPAARLAAVLIPHHADTGVIIGWWVAITLELVFCFGQGRCGALPADGALLNSLGCQRARNKHR